MNNSEKNSHDKTDSGDNKTPSPYHHGDLYEALIKSSLVLIKEKGIHGLSLREVARQAGVSHSAPAHHFKDKSGLITAIAVRGYDQLNESLLTLNLKGLDTTKEFKETGKAYVRFAAKNPAYFEAMFQPTLHQKDNEELSAASLTAYKHLKNIAERMTDALKAKVDPETLALRAWSTAHGLTQLWLSGNLSHNFDPILLDKAIEAVFERVDSPFNLLPN